MSSTTRSSLRPACPQLEIHHELRQHADDSAAVRDRAVRERAHRADRAAAVDDGHAKVREDRAEAPRDVVILGVAGAARRAVDADALRSIAHADAHSSRRKPY